MKKQLLVLAAMLTAVFTANADCSDGPYALYVNGSSVCAFEDAGMSPDNLPQLHAVASLKQGDKVEFCNTSCDAKWFPQNIETGGEVDGSGNFAIEKGTVATCNVDGCYNFWWKKLNGDDRVYIGTDGDCSGNGGNGGGDNGNGGNGGNNGGGDSGSYTYWLIGNFDGEDKGDATDFSNTYDEYKFQDGKLTVQFPDTKGGGYSYAGVKDSEGNWYMTKAWDQSINTADHIELYWTGNNYPEPNKWRLPNSQQLYIIMTKCSFKDQIDLKLVDKATYDAYHLGNGDNGGGENGGGENGGSENGGGENGGGENGGGSQNGITVRLQKPADWSEVYIYAWGENAPDLLGPWPGVAATEIGSGWFGHSFTESTISVVFNNNQDPVTQTVDIKDITASTCYVLGEANAEGKYEVTVSTDCPAVENALEEVVVELDLNAPMYNVLGQKVDNNYRGIVIQNGHKFLIY